MSEITVISSAFTRDQLRPYLLNDEMVKAVVDIEKGLMAVGGALHADEEQILLDQGSNQEDLWGINLYLNESETEDFIEFDSMINIRPRLSNRSRSVEDGALQQKIIRVVTTLVS